MNFATARWRLCMCVVDLNDTQFKKNNENGEDYRRQHIKKTDNFARILTRGTVALHSDENGKLMKKYEELSVFLINCLRDYLVCACVKIDHL